MSLTVLAYLLAAAAQGAAGLHLLLRYRHNDVARRVAFACGLGVLWAATLAALPTGDSRWLWLAALAEALRYLALFVACAAPSPLKPPAWLMRLAIGVVVLLAAGGVAGLFGVLDRYALGVLITGGIAMAVMGLVLSEQVLRNAPAHASNAVRYMFVGIGGQFAYDLFLYSQAQLLVGFDAPALAMRGVVVAVLVWPCVISARRAPVAEPQLFISRHVVFYTSSFVAVGAYLCLMAFGGYYVREVGNQWGRALELLFLCGAVLVLAILLITDSPLRRLRVFIATHFYRNKYDYRIEWLRFVRTLSSADEADPRRTAVQAVAQLMQSPGGLLLWRQPDDVHFRAEAQWPEGLGIGAERIQLSLDHELAVFMAGKEWVVDLNEYRDYPERYRNIALPAWLTVDGPWRIVAPLLLGRDLLGLLLLRSPQEPFAMTFEDRDLLKTVGRHLAVHLAQRNADQKLTESRQFDAFNRLSSFVMHDLKNAVAQLQLIITNAARHKGNPEFFDDSISTISNTVDRMTRLIEQLGGRGGSRPLRVVDLETLINAVIARNAVRQPAPRLVASAGPAHVEADPERLEAVLDHVIRNAQDATPVDGNIEVSLAAEGPRVHLTVSDDGVGMDEEFMRQRLFKPFESTKGAKGMGIGAYQVREYVRSLGGDVNVQSIPGQGTRFSISVKLCQQKNPAS